MYKDNATDTVNYTLKNASLMFNDIFGTKGRMPFIPVKHEQTYRLGYNLNFRKGTFATAFDRKEYFESHIRPQNKRDLEPGIVINKNKRNNANFIEYDK